MEDFQKIIVQMMESRYSNKKNYNNNNNKEMRKDSYKQ